MSLFTEYEFSKCVNRYKGDRHAIKFNCRDQFLVMSFAQFTDRSRKGINRYLLFIKMYKAIAALVPESSLGNQLNSIVKSSKQAMPASLSTL